MKKNGKEYLSLCEGRRINGKTVQKHIRYLGVVPTIGDENTPKRDKKLIRNAQIIDSLIKGKLKEDLAYLYNITTKTIDNIWKKYNSQGLENTMHTRSSKYETVKVSSPEQATIITDYVQNPDKNAKEIKKTNHIKSTVSDIKKLISPLAEALKLKKKILLEIE